jgi:hypothetical protein
VEGSFEVAWRKFDDSFADDQEETLDSIHDAFLKNIEYITPVNLDATVRTFKKLGQTGQAMELLSRYVEARGEELGLFDLQNPFSQVEDSDVKATFEKKAAEPHEMPDFVTLLAEAKHHWSPDRRKALAAAHVTDYYQAFKSRSGDGHRRLVRNALEFARVINPSEDMRMITEKATEALQVIARESPLNEYRVSRLGIGVSDPTGPPESDAG